MKKVIVSTSILTIAAGSVLLVINNVSQSVGKYFTISELCGSSTAKSKGIDNSPSEEVVKNLNTLIKKVLDPVRSIYGKPIRITSGYRCPELEAVISGAGSSQHMTGCAADMQPYSDGNLNDIFKAVISNGVYDQLIIEEANGKKWVHVSYSESLRKQILAYKDGKYVNITNSWQNYV